MGLSKTYKAGYLLTVLLVVVSCSYIVNEATGTTVHSAAKECERPVKGSIVHKFVEHELRFEPLAKHQRGTIYYHSSSQYGIAKRPKRMGVKKKFWYSAVGRGNTRARWIYVPYPDNDRVYPTLSSESNLPSLQNFLGRNVLINSPSARSRAIEKIYKLAERAGVSSLQAVTAAAKPCKNKRLAGQVFWREVVVKKLRYKRGKGQPRSSRIETVYRSKISGLEELGEDQYRRIVRDNQLDRRDLFQFLTSYIGLSESQAKGLISDLAEIYYIPDVD